MSDSITKAMKLAFEVTISDMCCIVFSETPAKARWQAVKSYWDAGYGRNGVWPRPAAARVPRLDGSPLRNERQKAWVPEYAESTI